MAMGRSEFMTQVRERVTAALAATSGRRAVAQQEDTALRHRLALIAVDVENLFNYAALAVAGQLTYEVKGLPEERVVRLLWGGPPPPRTLGVTISLPRRLVEWAWYTPELGEAHHTVAAPDLETFDPQALVFQLIDPAPWLEGRFPT
jgi:hypothetical protein